MRGDNKNSEMLLNFAVNTFIMNVNFCCQYCNFLEYFNFPTHLFANFIKKLLQIIMECILNLHTITLQFRKNIKEVPIFSS